VAVLAMLVLSAAPVGAAGMKFGDAAPLNSYAAVDDAGGYRSNDRVPELTTDGAGNWVAVWRSEYDTGGIGGDWDILFARSTDNGATWSAAAPLNSYATVNTGWNWNPINNAGGVPVTTDSAGNWVAVWTSGYPTTDPAIMFARSTDNGATWSAAAPLHSPSTGDGTIDWSPQLTTDSAGNWVAVWSSGYDTGGIGNDSDILFVRSTDNGATWSAAAPLNSYADVDSNGWDGDSDLFPQLTTDSAGNWVAVWMGSYDTGGIGVDYDILFARSTDNGATWSAAAPLNSYAAVDPGGDYDDLSPQLTTDSAGNWVAVWGSKYDTGGIGDDYDILFARSTDNGATWSVAAPLNSYAAVDSDSSDFSSLWNYSYPQLTTDSAGNWVAVWESSYDTGGIGDDSDIMFARSTDNGATWSAAAPLNSHAAVDSNSDFVPQLTSDSAGNWVAVWASSYDTGGIGNDWDILFARGAICGDGVVGPGEDCDPPFSEGGSPFCFDDCTSAFEFPEGAPGCIAAMNKAAFKLAKVQEKENASCVKDAGRGREASVAECVRADRRGKVAKAIAKLEKVDTTKCEVFAVNPAPPYGYVAAADAAAEVLDHEVGTLVDLLGDDADAAIIASDTDRDGARCQAAVFKTMGGVMKSGLGSFAYWKKKGLLEVPELPVLPGPLVEGFEAIKTDARGKLARSVAKVEKAVLKKCATVDLGLAFPGECALADRSVAPAAFVDCVQRVVLARMARLINGVDNLEYDCDQFDNDVTDGSCWPWKLLPCVVASSPACAGTCPYPQLCEQSGVVTAALCECVDPPGDPCESLAGPTCDGWCSTPGQVCEYSAGLQECECVDPPGDPCESLAGPTCNGVCINPGQVCEYSAGLQECECVDPPEDPCESLGGPTCNGVCIDPAQACIADPTGAPGCLCL
jgi:hypothetical protein